jgi:hypothetical protein
MNKYWNIGEDYCIVTYTEGNDYCTFRLPDDGLDSTEVELYKYDMRHLSLALLEILQKMDLRHGK